MPLSFLMCIKLPVLIFRFCCLASCLCVVSNLSDKVKVKCTFVHALRLCTGRTAHRGSRGIALLFLDHGTRRGEGSASRPGHSLPPGKTRYPFYRRLDGPQGRSGQVRKISPPTGIRSPDRPARSQSLYRLRYPTHNLSDRSYFAVGILSCTSKVWVPRPELGLFPCRHQ